MFNEYMYKVDGKVVAINDKNDIEEKENHEKIEEELNLINEIEVINNNIIENENAKDHYYSLKNKLFKIPKKAFVFMVSIFFTIGGVMKFKSWPVAGEHISSGYVAFALTEAIIYSLFCLPITIVDCMNNIIFKRNIEELNIMNEYLEKELTKKQEKLEEIQNTKIKTNTVDDEIHKLNTTDYKEQIKNELIEYLHYCELLKHGEVLDYPELTQENDKQLKLQK